SVIGAFTGGASTSTTLGDGSSVMPPKPVKPGDSETTDSATKIESEVDSALAKRVRNLTLSNKALSDEERVFIQNMSDKQILEMVAVVTKQEEDQDSAENEISDDEIIEEKEATVEEDDWFTQVKDQWTEGKAQREERRETRQQRRAERQAQDD
ncbi:uncharacterized protein METZ01_LOCUS243782, partial [marine metagenome]